MDPVKPPLRPWPLSEDPAAVQHADPPTGPEDLDADLEELWDELEAAFTGILIY